nr:MAG TPA: hypothetical protein [Caudoviricetes sp.]
MIRSDSLRHKCHTSLIHLPWVYQGVMTLILFFSCLFIVVL